MVQGDPTSADRIVFMGHSTVLIELDGVRLLTDPLLRRRVAHLRRHPPVPDLQTAAGADTVLISHLHHDHFDLPSLRLLGEGAELVVPRGLGAWVRGRGFTRVSELEVGEQLQAGAVSVTAVPARHNGHRFPAGPRGESLGYLVAGTQKIYFAGDTALFGEMSGLAADLDIALLPIAGWAPKLGPGHMNAHDAACAARLLEARIAVPIHWGTLLPMGLGGRHRAHLEEPPREFARELARLAPATQARILRPGEQMPL